MKEGRVHSLSLEVGRQRNDDTGRIGPTRITNPEICI